MKLTICFLFFITFYNPTFGMDYSRNIRPSFGGHYYVEESLKYFDTLDTYASRDSKPVYSSHAIRWEWYPWLFLTGYKKYFFKLDYFLTLYPTKVINRDCRSFSIQPFGRCRVTFHYLKSDTKHEIYEEFTFNEKGEITFIEAWTDNIAYLPLRNNDPWGETNLFHRLSTKVPGLGSQNGRYNRKNLKKLSKKDEDLKNLLKRLRFPVSFWLYEGLRYVFKH